MFSLENIDDSRQIYLFLESLKFQFDCLFTRMASNRDFYQPTLIALEVIDEINNDLDSDEEDLYEGNESYDDEEGGDIFTNLMRAAIDRVGHLRIFPEFRIFFYLRGKKNLSPAS